MNPRTFPALFLCLPLAISAETLPEAVSQALRSNPRALAALHAEQAALSEIHAARGRLAPTALLRGASGPGFRDRSIEGLGSDGDWLYSDDLRLSIRQHVFDGQGKRNQVYAAAEMALAANLTHRQTQEEVAFGVAGAYLGLLQARDLIRVAQANVDAHQAALDDAATRAAAGDERADQALVTGRLGLAKSRLHALQASLRSAQSSYERFVGHPPAEPLVLPEPLEWFPAAREEIDTRGNWSYQAAEKIADARAHEFEAAKAARLPQVELEATGGVGYDMQGIRGPNNETTVLMVGSWNVFDRSRNPTIAAAANRAEEGRFLADEERRIADELAGEAWAEFVATREQQDALRSYQAELGAVLNDYEEQFTVAKRSFLNVLDVRNERFSAETSLVEARYRERMAQYRLLASTGRLTDVLGIELEAPGEAPEPSAAVGPLPAAEVSAPAEPVSSVRPSGRERLKELGRFWGKSP